MPLENITFIVEWIFVELLVSERFKFICIHLEIWETICAMGDKIVTHLEILAGIIKITVVLEAGNRI